MFAVTSFQENRHAPNARDQRSGHEQRESRSAALWSGSDLFKREVREVGPFLGMLDRNGADVPATIVNLGVFVEVLGLDDLASPELDIKGIRVAKVLDLHGSNERMRRYHAQS